MVTPTSTDTLTNKYFDGGTASSTNKLKLPSDTYANLVALAGKAEGQLYYATDTDKIYSFDGTNLKVAGGGLLTVPKSFSDGDFTAEAGKHYLVDMTGVNALRTITLPAGAAEAVVKISCVNNTSATYPLTIDGNGTEKIFYNATQNLNVNFPYAEQWCELSWDTNDSQWIVNDGSTPLSGTWSGSLDMTGILKVDTIQEHTATKGVAIQGRTDGQPVASGYVGEIKELGGVGTGAGITSNVINDSNLGALTLQKGGWDIQLVVYFGFTTVTGLQSLWCFIGTASGNNTTGRDQLKNAINARFGTPGLSSLEDYSIATPVYRVNLAADTNYYAKSYAFFGGGSTSATAYMRATRVS
jgi:hypothetical protein